MLQSLSLQGFEDLLVECSDYEIKMNNSEQDRIFSYDKPNKYRSDISNIIHCLLNNTNIFNARQKLPEIIERLFAKARVSLESASNSVDRYASDIINRNEVYLRVFSFNFKPWWEYFWWERISVRKNLKSYLSSIPYWRTCIRCITLNEWLMINKRIIKLFHQSCQSYTKWMYYIICLFFES